jgi:hypothetical protein
MRYALFWDVTQGRLVVNDVSERPIGPIFKGPIGCPETTITNYQYTLRNVPEEQRSHLQRRGSLESRRHQQNLHKGCNVCMTFIYGVAYLTAIWLAQISE